MRREHTEIGKRELDDLAVYLYRNRDALGADVTDIEAVNGWADSRGIRISSVYDAVKLLDQVRTHRNLPVEDYGKALEMDGLVEPGSF